ncbi:cell cycle and apoptosis regulator protein 2 [Theristicus caerulescens]
MCCLFSSPPPPPNLSAEPPAPCRAAAAAADPEPPGTAPTRAIPGQQQGILGARPQRLLQPHRIPPLSFPGNGRGEEEEGLLLAQGPVALSPRRWPRCPWITWSKGRLPSTRQNKVWTQACAGLGSPASLPAAGKVQLPAFCWDSWATPDRRSPPCRRVWFAECRYRWEVVVISLLDSPEEWEASCQPKAEKGPSLPPLPEEKRAMVRLCRGAERGDAGCRDSSGVPKGGFISVSAWTGLCFEGEVLLWVTAPSTFSSRSHLNRAVFSRWRPPSSTWLPQAPPSDHRSPNPPGNQPSWPIPTQPGRTGRLPAPASPSAPRWSAGGGGRSSPPSRLDTAQAGRSPVPLSLPEVAVMVAKFFQEMLQRDFGYKHYKALLALPEKEGPPETRNLEPRKGY